MNKKFYYAPIVEVVVLKCEENFLISGNGSVEVANETNGSWDD